MPYVESAPSNEAVMLRVLGSAWLPVAWTGEMGMDPQPRVIEHVSMGGSRSVTILPSRTRSWSVNGSGPLAWWRNLQRVAGGEFGVGPFEMLHPLAARTNMVARGGDIAGASSGGLATLDGEPYRLWVAPSQTARFPIQPGVPLQGRAIIGGTGATMRLSWYSSSDALLGSATAAGAGTSAWTTVTGTPPSNAAWGRIVPFGATLAGAAQVRLTVDNDGTYYAPAGVQQVAVVPGGSSHDWINTRTIHATPIASSVTILEVEP